MPSGSHSGGHGGGGSHFGGGGSSGGSHGGGSFGGRNRGYRNGRTVYYFGRGYNRCYMYGGAYTAFSLLRAIGIFMLVIGVVILFTLSGYNSQLKNIKADYLYYQDMISDAEEHLANGDDSYFVDGVVISKFKNSGCDKWYITYYFLDKDGKRVEGYTYSIYTWEQVKDMDNGDIIKLAVDSKPITQDTDSVNVDYKDTSLMDDGEYAKIVRHKKNTRNASIILISIAVGLIAISIIVRVKASKKVLNDDQDSDQSSGNGYRRCACCDRYLEPGETICKDCGARVK